MTTTELATGSDKSGIPPQATGSGGKAANGGADPFSGLQDAGIREWLGKAGFKDTTVSTFESLAKKAHDTESLIGRSVQLPADDAKPEDIDKFVQKATAKYRPEKADGYELKLPDGVPKEMPYDGEFAKEFKGVAHDLGLTAAQAQRAHDWFVKRQAGAYTAGAEQLVKTGGDATAALEKTFGGASTSDAFKEGIERVLKGIDGVSELAKLGKGELMQSLRDAKLVGPGDIILSVPIVRAFAEIGKLYAEDRLVTGGGGGADNPFVAGKDNETEQLRISKADPDKARRLIRQAGREADFPSFMLGSTKA